MNSTGSKQEIELKDLKEQVLVITGASSGIGLKTARMAAKQGARIVAASRNESALQQLIEELREQGAEAIWVKADVSKEAEVENITEAANSAFGGFDTWVNNAGVSIFGKAMEVDMKDMRHMFDTTFWGVVYGSRAAVNHFKESGKSGALINIGSFYGDRGTVVQSSYSAAKFALHGWTENLRMELEKDKAPISVTLIHPGRIDTPYNEHAASYLENKPSHIGMMYGPDAVADAILYAASHPKRDMYVGFQAKSLAVLGRLSPRLMDKWMELTMFRTQQDPKRPINPPETNSLYEPGYGLHERGTNKGWVRKKSWYVKVTKHPILSAAALAGIGVSLLALNKKK
ncbi:SDR family oxidoreductase [Terribacillus saccharophilus]|uniref:SDR family oxidoreductase n=1 Tax=Terribacillus saccharophilus TaxID=361277 RepID=UPI0039820673